MAGATDEPGQPGGIHDVGRSRVAARADAGGDDRVDIGRDGRIEPEYALQVLFARQRIEPGFQTFPRMRARACPGPLEQRPAYPGRYLEIAQRTIPGVAHMPRPAAAFKKEADVDAVLQPVQEAVVVVAEANRLGAARRGTVVELPGDPEPVVIVGVSRRIARSSRVLSGGMEKPLEPCGAVRRQPLTSNSFCFDSPPNTGWSSRIRQRADSGIVVANSYAAPRPARPAPTTAVSKTSPVSIQSGCTASKRPWRMRCASNTAPGVLPCDAA